MARPKRQPAKSARAERPPPNTRKQLEAKIPDDLKLVPKKCPREDCGSEKVEIKYFDNKQKVGYRQPRYVCHGCTQTFTLGGKVREPHKTSNTETNKSRARNPRPKTGETGEYSGAAHALSDPAAPAETASSSREDEEWISAEEMEERYEDTDEETVVSAEEDDDWMPPRMATDHQATEEPAEDQRIPAEETEEPCVEGWILARVPVEPVQETDNSEDDTLAMLMKTKLDELRDAVAELMKTDDRREEVSSTRPLSKKERLVQKTRDHLQRARETLIEMYIEKAAMELQLECHEMEQLRERENRRARRHDEEAIHLVKESIVEFVNVYRKAAEITYSLVPYNEMVAREGKVEKVTNEVEAMQSQVEGMNIRSAKETRMVNLEKKAKRLWDRVHALAY